MKLLEKTLLVPGRSLWWIPMSIFYKLTKRLWCEYQALKEKDLMRWLTGSDQQARECLKGFITPQLPRSIRCVVNGPLPERPYTVSIVWPCGPFFAGEGKAGGCSVAGQRQNRVWTDVSSCCEKEPCCYALDGWSCKSWHDSFGLKCNQRHS